MSNDLMYEIICLADRVEPDSEAVREWFFDIPLFPYSKTALELVHADLGDVVITFLRRILRDIDPDPKPLVSHHLREQPQQHVAVTSGGMDSYINVTSKSGVHPDIGSKELLRAQRNRTT